MARIIGLETADVRFPTSLQLDGSDAMNVSPDYAAAYVSVRLSDDTSGHGLAFTIGYGNALQVAAIQLLEPLCVGHELGDGIDGLIDLNRRLIGESQLRWLGPEKGVIHMAIGAVMNAAYDAVAKQEGMPLWRFLAELEPEDLIRLVDFRYLTDSLPPNDALELLKSTAKGKADRIAELEEIGYPAYTSSPGWLGYSDDKLARLCQEAVVDQGFDQVKLKVGRSLDEDVRRCEIARRVIGDDIRLAIDANQVWDVEPAIAWVNELARFDLAWIEEPTSPDDILGLARIRAGVAPVPVATGEHVANRVMFKQLLQAEAVDVVQIDATRVAGYGENLAVLLLAARHGVPVCPHAGGVGLCEVVQHLSFLDYVAISGSLDGRRIEWIDHLHQHFVEPAAIAAGRYVGPAKPGASAEMLPESVTAFSYPDGPVWREAAADSATSALG
jgi:L-fuconate dehydratase